MSIAQQKFDNARENAKPAPEQTAPQISSKNGNWKPSAFGAGQGFKGFDPPKSGTFDVYREISAHPTVALALHATVGRILANEWGWSKKTDDVSDEWVESLEEWFGPRRNQILHDGMKALRYGFAPFEQVWDVVDDLPGGKMMLPTLKPLRVDYTEFLQAQGKGIVGLRNKAPGVAPVDLDWSKAFAYSFDGEFGDPYGRSLLENVRTFYSESCQIRQRYAKYASKVSGVIGQIHYPDGTSRDSAGAERPNFWLAQQVARDAADGKWLVFNNKFASFIDENGMMTPAGMEKALAAAGKSEWVVSFVDPGGTDFAPGFKETLLYYDALMVRGLMQAERALLESSHGSRADSQTHTEVGIMFAELLDKDFAEAFNRGVIDDVLEVNFGVAARGKVFIEPAPISDTSFDAKLQIALALIAGAATGEATGRKIDVDALLDDLNVEISEDEEGPIGDLIDMSNYIAGNSLQDDSEPKPTNGNGKLAKKAAGRMK